MNTPNQGFSDFDFDTLLQKLCNDEPFHFIRYGDGEMQCILQTGKKENCDGHQYFPDLGNALSDVLDAQHGKQTYYIGIQRLGDNLYPTFKDQWPLIKWCNADILHHASIKGRFGELLELIDSSCLLVGPNHLSKLSNPASIITVSSKDCWKDYRYTFQNIVTAVETELYPIIDKIFFSCSMMAEPLIHELAQKYPDVTMIDAGSVFDPYCFVKSRSYHHKLEIK